MATNFKKRRTAFRRLIKIQGGDAALVTDFINVTYLTGFTGDSSYLLLTSKQDILLSDSRYSIQIQEQCPDLECEIRKTSRTSLNQFAARTIKSAKPRNLVVEAHKLTKFAFDELEQSVAGVNLIPTSGLVEQLRAIKDKHEIKTIQQSIRIAERAFTSIRAQLTPDQTELQIAHNLEHQIRNLGGTRCSFDPIVGVGPRGALPHGEPTELQVGSHPFLLIDWGAQFRGYASDLTRILVTGKISPKLTKIYNIVLKAQLAAIKKLRPGARLSEVDRAARKVIEEEGFGHRFGHGLGHGFGLEIHETPFLSTTSTGKLTAGMVVTIEPGIYLSGWGGVRIEDDVLITPDGHQVLSCVPKELDQSIVEIF